MFPITMRLVNVVSFHMREFPIAEVPQYAILSHVWIESIQNTAPGGISLPSWIGEISYQMFKRVPKQRLEFSRQKDIDQDPVLYKVAGACALARAQGLDWLWIDTFCINRMSSTEVYTAIYSMFSWYRNAKVCYAYLPDVDWSHGNNTEAFIKSIWFKRGWTLQELLAPKEVIFFDRHWSPIGTRTALSKEIQKASKISLEHLKDFRTASFAAKMSWMSERQTTKDEDMAYSLFGIVGVTMPIHYGEGKDAFRRLQEAVLERSTDESIFAWTSLPHDVIPASGMLAPGPRNFKNSGQVIRCLKQEQFRGAAYGLTNHGLRFPVPLHALRKRNLTSWNDEVDLPLQCWHPDRQGKLRTVIVRLRRRRGLSNEFFRTSMSVNIFERVESDTLLLGDANMKTWWADNGVSKTLDIYVPQIQGYD